MTDYLHHSYDLAWCEIKRDSGVSAPFRRLFRDIKLLPPLGHFEFGFRNSTAAQ